VDGGDVPDIKNYRVQSPLFNLSLPENNVQGVPAQEVQGVSDGYFVMLKPLSKGEHEIRSTGSLAEVTVEGTQIFASDVIYHITVEKETRQWYDVPQPRIDPCFSIDERVKFNYYSIELYVVSTKIRYLSIFEQSTL